MTTKIKAKQVIILGGEGVNNGRREFDSFEAASDYIRGTVAANAPKTGGDNKTNFRIIWEDGQIYDGRLDVKHQTCEGNDNDIGQHIWDFLAFIAGRWKPNWMTNEQYDARSGKDGAGEARDYLDKYDIPGDRTIVKRCDACSTEMRLLPEDVVTICNKCVYEKQTAETTRKKREEREADPLYKTSQDRKQTIAAIRKFLKDRSGKAWSVTGGKGTSWGWLHISAPPKRQDKFGFTSPEDCRELSTLMGKLSIVHNQGLSVSSDSWLWALRAARGDFSDKNDWKRNYHPLPEHINHVFNVCAENPSTEAEIHAAYDQMANQYSLHEHTLNHVLYIMAKREMIFLMEDGRYTTEKPGANEPKEDEAAAQPPASLPQNQSLANRLNKMADGMNAAIEKKRNTFADANITHRRAQIIAAAHQDADRMVQIQNVLRTLASGWEAGNTPQELVNVKTKTAVQHMVADAYIVERYGEDRIAYWGQNSRYFTDKAAYIQALRLVKAMMEKTVDPEQEKKRQIEALEQEAYLNRPPDYFCTPPEVSEMMFAHIWLEAGDLVLEPSAGSGAMCDEIVKRWPGVKMDCIEIVGKLRKILSLKGYRLVGEDFLEYHEGGYNAIIMNPPFSNQQDIDHVTHAYDLLGNGGTMVSVMSPGPFFRQDNKAKDFREWFEKAGGMKYDLPANSFKDSGTGVNSVFVVIHK